jgi:hypothetical protein
VVEFGSECLTTLGLEQDKVPLDIGTTVRIVGVQKLFPAFENHEGIIVNVRYTADADG